MFERYRRVLELLTAMLRSLPPQWLMGLFDLFEPAGGLVGVGLRYCIARCLARSCGDNVLIGKNVEIRNWDRLDIGNNVSIHRSAYIDAAGEVKIGNNVSISHQVSIVSFNHTWDDHNLPIRKNLARFDRIAIGNDVWIGAGARLLAGSKVGDRSVVAAGAVVTKQFKGGVLVGGVPARVLGPLK